MVEPKRTGPTRQQRRVGVELAAAYYVIAGFIAAAFAVGEAQFIEENVPDLVVAAMVSVILLVTARRLWHVPPRLGLLVGVGVALGIAVAALPIVFILSVADIVGSIAVFGPQMPTVNLVLIFVPPLVLAVGSAVAVWRAARKGPPGA